MKITLLGAGAMGGALTFPLVESGHEVRLYGTGYDRQTIASLKQKQPHPRLNKQLPKKINLYEPEELEGAVRGTEILLLCVNTEGIRPIMDALLPYIKPERTLITIA
ncbi:MAG TPA: NAD(P)-binding domain-containing protein, partial [Opitutales bacterium]|nr:NAD(P)-binding domain-containing protein [Opitutales bacterium]